MSEKKNTFYAGKYDFLGKAKIIVPLTVLLMVFGFVDILVSGLNYGIDFAGGTEIQVRFNSPVAADEVRDLLDKTGYAGGSVQAFGSDNEFLIRLGTPTPSEGQDEQTAINEMVQKVSAGLTETFSGNQPEIRRVDSVGPAVGEELKRNGILAAFYSLLLILIYVGLRFDYKYAPAAVFCLFHDALITLSVFALLGREVNVQTLAAILTLIGYSLNDTIVTFDRIRETEKLYPDAGFFAIVNRGINDTLSRTILTALTTLLAVIALYIFADGVIREIAFTLAVGVIVGAYSSIYIAAPLVIAYDRWEKHRETVRMKRAMAKA